jgi:3-phosphoshikimate 1-carboxyvinyltransferase
LPLYDMGAQIHYESSHDMAPVADTAPFSITGGNLVGKSFDLKIPSAQVQAALLLAGLQAQGTTSVKIPGHMRDHTERMFKFIGVPFKKSSDGAIEVTKLDAPVAPFSISVPGDLSSAAFFMVAAACLPGSDVLVKNVGVNSGRNLIIEVLRRMGADIHFESQGEISGEPVADIRVRYAGRLRGVTVYGDTVATGIDEIPILALAGSLCEGEFTVLGADELRHKESNRLSSITENLQNLGVNIQATDGGFKIQGSAKLPGASFWRTYGDHRMAMTGMIANTIAQEPITLEESDSIKISYPSFAGHLKLLLGEKTGVS